MKKTMIFFGMLVLTMVLGLVSCTNDDNSVYPQKYDGVPLVIFDTDIGSSTDDLFSLEMLYHYQKQGKCKLLGVVVDREGEDLFMLSDRGTVELNDDGTVIFTFSATGNSRIQIPGDDAWRAAMLEKIRNVNKTH